MIYNSTVIIFISGQSLNSIPLQLNLSGIENSVIAGYSFASFNSVFSHSFYAGFINSSLNSINQLNVFSWIEVELAWLIEYSGIRMNYGWSLVMRSHVLKINWIWIAVNSNSFISAIISSLFMTVDLFLFTLFILLGLQFHLYLSLLAGAAV